MSAALLVSGACRESTAPTCDICTTSAAVAGRVTDAAGRAVAGALVTVEARPHSCGAAAALTWLSERGSPGPVATDGSGMYVARLRSLHGPFDACLVVTAVVPAGGAPGVASGARVRFTNEYPRLERADSVRVDVALPTP